MCSLDKYKIGGEKEYMRKKGCKFCLRRKKPKEWHPCFIKKKLDKAHVSIAPKVCLAISRT